MVVINKFLLLMQLGLAVGADRKYSFSVTNVCYQLYSDVISDAYDVKTIASCSTVCAKDSCCSYLFDETSQRCITYSYYAQSTSSGCEWKYAEIDLDICRGPAPYTPSAPNTCADGYSYDASSNRCVLECVSYGSTFGIFEGYVLSGFNDKTISGSSEPECMNACATEDTFVCRTAELSSSGSCYLSVDTALTQPDSYNPSSTYILWHRNCY